MIRLPWSRPVGLMFTLLASCLMVLSAGGAFAQTGSAKSAPPKADGLKTLFRALYALENNKLQGPVVILHLGDSHTAGGRFSSRLRDRFQERFGASGRGYLPPGVPFQWHRPGQVTVTQDKNWKVYSSFRKNSKGPFGLAGFRVVANKKPAQMTLQSEDEAGFDQVEIELLDQPDGGAMSIWIDDHEVETIKTAHPSTRVRRVAARTKPGSRKLTLKTKGDGPVELLAWSVRRSNPGIIYESHGIVGATVDIIGRWDEGVLEWELVNRNPVMIVIEYGGNEGFHDDLGEREYKKIFVERITTLRRYAPKASILVIGPSDGNRLPKYCRSSARPWDRFSYEPLTDWELAHYGELIKSEDGPLCRWHSPPKLDMVRRIQREAARDNKFSFWDWHAFMGGEGSVHKWALQKPSLAAKDHVHLQKKGYIASADALFKAMMTEYDRYKKALVKEPKQP